MILLVCLKKAWGKDMQYLLKEVNEYFTFINYFFRDTSDNVYSRKLLRIKLLLLILFISLLLGFLLLYLSRLDTCRKKNMVEKSK